MHRFLPTVAAPLLLAVATTLLCFSAAGASTGTFFGGVAFALLIAPPFVAAEDSLANQLLIAAAVFTGVALAWLLALRDPYVAARHWLSAVTVLAATIAAAGGVVSSLRPLRLPPALASALTIIGFSLWLTWPIWLSPRLAGRETLTHALAVAHPLLAIDHALADLGPPWTERPLMYTQLSILNQDVAYSLPTTIAWTVLLHGAIGAAGFLASAFHRPSTSKDEVTPAASASAAPDSASA